jgi:hypothetical protein
MAKNQAAEPTTATPAEPTTDPAEPVTIEPVSEPTAGTVKDAAWWESKAKAMEAEKVATAKKLAKLESAEQARHDAELTELEKANQRAEKAEAEAKAARLDVLRRDVAGNKLDPVLAARLKGETREEMEADLVIVLAAMPKQVAPKLEPTNPSAPQKGETDAEKRKRLLG